MDYFAAHIRRRGCKMSEHVSDNSTVDSSPEMDSAESSDGEAPVQIVNVVVGTSLYEVERRVIDATLQSCGGNKTKTAAMLGVSLKTLYNRLNDYRRQDGDGGKAMEFTNSHAPNLAGQHH